MSQLPSLITKVSNLNVETSKKVSAFLGAVVGDAASLHLEWIYDQAKVLDIVGGKDKDPAFWPDSHVPFFTLPNGKVSCYNDEAIQALSVMAKNDGKYDTGKLIDHFLIHFGDPESPYQIAKAKRVDKKYPIEGPWIQGTLISMMDRYKAGINPPGPEDAEDHDGLCTALPLMIQQSPDLNMEELKSCFQVVSTKPDAITHYEVEAFLLNEYLKGTENPIEATKDHFKENEMILNEINAVLEGKKAGQSAEELVKKFGLACPLPGSFQSSLVTLVGAQSYADGIKEAIFCGGDSCSRSNLIGACLGAKFGISAIPQEWLAKVDGIEELIDNCMKVFDK